VRNSWIEDMKEKNISKYFNLVFLFLFIILFIRYLRGEQGLSTWPPRQEGLKWY